MKTKCYKNPVHDPHGAAAAFTPALTLAGRPFYVLSTYFWRRKCKGPLKAFPRFNQCYASRADINRSSTHRIQSLGLLMLTCVLLFRTVPLEYVQKHLRHTRNMGSNKRCS